MRKIILILITALTVNIFSVSVYASNSPSITAGDVVGEIGDIVEIPVILENNTGFSNISIEIGYESNALELVKVTSESTGATFTEAENYMVNPFNMSWDSAENVNYNGTLVTLSFKIITSVNDIYPITVGYFKGRDKTFTDGVNVNYNESFEPLNLSYKNGSVTVVGSSIGGGNSGGESSIIVSGISFTVKLAGDTDTGTVYAALYTSDGSLRSLKKYSASETVNVAFDAGETGSYVKILWWNDAMQPMYNAQSIPLN